VPAAPKRLAVARFEFKTNAFCPLPLTLEDLQGAEWKGADEGHAALAAHHERDTALGAVARFAQSRTDWAVSVLRCVAAMPAGPLEDAAFEAVLEDIVTGLRRGEWDAVYLCLHGACSTPTRASADADLVAAVRDAIGPVPLAASFDTQANLDPQTLALLDIATGGGFDPGGTAEAAGRALRLLVDKAEGRSDPRGSLQSTGWMLPRLNQRASRAALDALQEAAALLRSSVILDVSFFTGFPYADTPHCGAKVLVWADGDPAMARHAAAQLVGAWETQRAQFRLALPGAHAALAEALKSTEALTVVTDGSDDPMSGGLADTPALLRALLDLAPDRPAVFACLTDADTVARAHAAGTGAELDVELGAKHSRDFGATVPVRVRIARLSDGRYRSEAAASGGCDRDVGRSAVLETGRIAIIVTERRAFPADPAFLQLHGITLADVALLCLKAHNAAAAGLGAISYRVIDCDAPGPVTADLRALPFERLRLR
jgi:microcystin degradation protein MlrC